MEYIVDIQDMIHVLPVCHCQRFAFTLCSIIGYICLLLFDLEIGVVLNLFIEGEL